MPDMDLSKLDLQPDYSTTKPSDYLHPLSGPIAGESWTKPPKSLPYDRPPQFTDPNKALHFMFGNMMRPQTVGMLLSMLEAGIPISMLVQILCTHASAEGTISLPMSNLLAPPLTVIIIRMAQAAKIDFNLTPDANKPEQIPDMMLKLQHYRANANQVNAATAALKKSAPEVADKHVGIGFITPKGFA